MVVPPNTIDFGSVFTKFNLSDNAGVFATVISILGLYMFVALYARYKDKRDIIKVISISSYYYLNNRFNVAIFQVGCHSSK